MVAAAGDEKGSGHRGAERGSVLGPSVLGGDDFREALLMLASVRGVGPVAFREALARVDGVDAALAELSPQARREAHSRAQAIARNAHQAGATLLVQGEAAYPPALLDLEDAPPYLFSLGAASWLATPMISIVGTREATSYGERTARRFASELSDAGITVVSGLARGIDVAAHRGALDKTGATIAVLAGGADLPTPPRHRALHETIVARGLIVAERPCGTAPRPGSFPRRNRLIAALGAATVVVEAGVKSGARITADLAIALGRPVGAVPGDIESPVSVGTNILIRDGATPVTSIDDILMLAHLTAIAHSRREKLSTPAPKTLTDSPLDEFLWSRLRREPATLDMLVVETERSAREVLRALTTLEVAGLVRAEA
ncbi:MAG: DNA-processing protein DprA, partial [Gemmatimonadaceae bacterium]